MIAKAIPSRLEAETFTVDNDYSDDKELSEEMIDETRRKVFLRVIRRRGHLAGRNDSSTGIENSVGPDSEPGTSCDLT